MSFHKQIGGTRTSLKNPSALIVQDFKPSGPPTGSGGSKEFYILIFVEDIEVYKADSQKRSGTYSRKAAQTISPTFRIRAPGFGSHSPHTFVILQLTH